MLKVRVRVFKDMTHFWDWTESGHHEPLPLVEYTMDHDDPVQRRRLGESCRDAFEAGQVVVTRPVD